LARTLSSRCHELYLFVILLMCRISTLCPSLFYIRHWHRAFSDFSQASDSSGCCEFCYLISTNSMISWYLDNRGILCILLLCYELCTLIFTSSISSFNLDNRVGHFAERSHLIVTSSVMKFPRTLSFSANLDDWVEHSAGRSIYASTPLYNRGSAVCVCVCLRVCVCVCVCVCVGTRVLSHLLTMCTFRKCNLKCVCECVCLCVHMWVCVHLEQRQYGVQPIPHELTSWKVSTKLEAQSS